MIAPWQLNQRLGALLSALASMETMVHAYAIEHGNDASDAIEYRYFEIVESICVSLTDHEIAIKEAMVFFLEQQGGIGG